MATLSMRWQGKSAVPPAKARDWWFDLQPDDHGQPEYGKHAGKARREVVERTPQRVRTRDTWGSWTFPAEVRREGEALAYTVGEGKWVQHATLRFHPEGQGSRLDWDGTVEVGGFFGLLAGLMRGKFERQFAEDMALHLAHMEREWRERPW